MFGRMFSAVLAVAVLCVSAAWTVYGMDDRPVEASDGVAPTGRAHDPTNRPDAFEDAATDTLVLTQAGVMELAAARAPQVIEAEGRLAEARGRLKGAGVLALDNPQIEILAGDPAVGARRTQMEISVPVGPGFKRGRRVGFARAEVERDLHLTHDARRLAIGAALESWYRLLHAERRLDLAELRMVLAGQLHRSVEERFRSGDAARLDLNVADTELSRSMSEASLVRQDVISARAELSILLGVPSGQAWSVSGDLADRGLLERAASDSSIRERPDVMAAESQVRAARAERSLAGAGVVPDFAFRLNYENSDGVTEWLPGLALTVPLFNRGQGEAAQARAREDRARLELERRRITAASEVAAARQTYEAAVASVDELERRALPGALETDRMLEESYRAGKINLASMLLLRRETLETQREYVDRLLEAAIRGINLGLATGVWP